MTGLRKSSDERRAELISAARAVALAEGLEHVTGRKVAAKAGLSSGLVFFHFDGRQALLEAVLDALLEDIFGGLEVPEGDGPADERMLQFLEHRVSRLRHERRQLELFIDFWVLGTREASVRRRIREGLERYREQVRPLATRVASSRPGMTGDALAQVAVSFILGCALQVVMDSGRIDTAEYFEAVRSLFVASRPAAREKKS
ncbi:MAG: TetR/AcrR family transcriptional regulator [Myxococcaceae bacterium]